MFNTYIINKQNYDLLNRMNMNNILMVGGKVVNEYKIISSKDKAIILKNYDEIVSGEKKCTSYPRKQIELATSGMYINDEERKEKSIKDLCSQIENAQKEKKEPFVHDDSLTAWGNDAVNRYGLTVGDIINMKFGDKIEVIMFDRNVGDYISEKKAGSNYDPKKQGMTYATYIHGEGLTGLLHMHDIGVVHAPFIWEINRKAIGDNIFWGPIEGCNDMCGKSNKSVKKSINKSDKKPIDIYKLDKNIKVGWRGPAILMSDAKKYLPKHVVHYDTWWDDYLPFKEHNLSK